LCVAAAGSIAVLFKDATLLSGVTIVGDCHYLPQKAFADLLPCLFHWELDITDKRTYSLAPTDYPKLPLFLFVGTTSHLNQVFWLV
jgi:hypothetical protein